MLLYIPKPRQFTAATMSTVTTTDRRAALEHRAAVSIANLKKFQEKLKILEADLLIAEDLELTKTWELEGAKLALSMIMNR
jgi:hypothetical protein